MNTRIAGLLGGVAAVVMLTGAQAAPAANLPEGSLRAHSYTDLLQPIPNAAALLQADDAAHVQQGPARVQLAQYHHHHHHHGFFPGAALGFLGGVLASQPYYDEAPSVYMAPGPVYGGDEAYCMRRFKSYDPESGTYLGYDGYRHPCP